MGEFYYNEIKEIEEIEGVVPFKYILSVPPIDFFEYTLSKQQIEKNLEDKEKAYCVELDYCAPTINGFKDLNLLEEYISNYVNTIEGDKPHTIRYTSIPDSGGECELVIIAKVYNDGTCFIFSNSRKYLELVKDRSCI
jgi:hypothetical protein